MKLAAMTTGDSLISIVADTFADAGYLLLLELDETTGEHRLLETVPRRGASDTDLARRIVEADCEAVFCGPIEEAPFTIIADEGCVTRYLAALLSVEEAVREMQAYRLEMITDYIGGTGCHSGEGCEHHDHGEE